jgi:predicted nucleotidyltransferase
MAKTALELTAKELQRYRPYRETDEREILKRWEQAWEVARAAARLLRERFGAHRVVAFGSLARREWFTLWSDIDLAAWGIPAQDFYRAVAKVTGISPDFEVDLVDPESCRPALRRVIEREGIEL